MRRGSMGSVLAVCAAALALAAAGDVRGAEWPQWRGPGRDGVAVGFDAPKAWPEKLRKVWSTQVGGGLASPIVVGNRVYVHSRRGDDEVVSAVELSSGKLLWSDSYRSPFPLTSEARPYGDGPYATPTWHDGRLYTFGMNEVLSAYDAASGKLLWRRDWSTEYKIPRPYYGAAAAPLLVDGLCIVYVGGPGKGALLALDARTGDPRWRLDGEGPPYGAAMVASFGGVRQIVTQSEYSLLGVELATGKQLWRRDWRVPYGNVILTPVLHGDRFIISALDVDAQAIRVFREGGVWKTEVAWSNREGTMYISTPVLAGGRLYGFTTRKKGSVYSLDPATGKILWTSPGGLGETASLVAAGDYLFILLETADLLVARKGTDAWTPVARYDDVADSATQGYPVILGDRILVKDRERLTLWSLKGEGTAKAAR